MCIAEEDYLRDGFNKTDAIVSSLDLNQAVAEVIPVVFSLTEKRCLLFLVKLRNTHTCLLLHYLTHIVQQVCLTVLCVAESLGHIAINVIPMNFLHVSP